jgi:ribonuclease P protein component
MLSRRYRLKRSGLLTRCLKSGKRLRRAEFMDVIALPKVRDPSHPRFTVVVSKKVSNRATKRNKLRRQLYELVRVSLLAEDTGCEAAHAYSAVIIFVKPTALGQPFSALAQDFTGAWGVSAPNKMKKAENC